MSKSKPTLAIVGAGSRGLTVYADYAEHNPEDCQVVAVAEPRDWHREETVRRHQLSSDRVFRDWRELAAQPRLAEAVVIATQDADHLEPALALMALGYDILLEKPMDITESGCRQLVAAARQHKVLLVVSHVLRYTPYFRQVKAILDTGELGQIVTLRHLEPVNFWHQAHSFVRGNWRRQDTSSPMILAKSCHDLDILLYLVGTNCQRVASFGRLSHFRAEQRPPGATARCLDCPLADGECPYSAKAFYLGMIERGDLDWPVNVLTTDLTHAGMTRALREGPYGRCVYDCDNDVVDHQVVILEFDPGITATFTMTAFTDKRWRETEILGSHGQLRGDGRYIRLLRFRDGSEQVWDLDDPTLIDGHGGGDAVLIRDFLAALRNREEALRDPGPEQALEGHLLAFAAERARLEKRVVEVP